MEKHIENLKNIKEHISTNITSQDLIHVFNILLKENMISQQEYSKAIIKIQNQFK